MTSVIVVLTFAVAALSARRYGFVSPCFLISGYSALTCGQMLLASGAVVDRWYASFSIGSSSLQAALIFFALSVAVYFASSFSERGGVGRGERNAIAFSYNAAKVVRVLRIMGWVAFVAVLYHCIVADWGGAVSYNNYMASRYPEFYGIEHGLGIAVHKALKLVGLLAAVNIGVFWRARGLPLILACITFGYVLLFHIGLSSKFAGVLVGIAGASLYVSNTGRLRALLSGLLAVVAVWITLVVLTVRESYQFGLLPFLYMLASPDLFVFPVLFQGSHLLLGGANLLRVSLERSFDFGLHYKISSFSPLVSAIDGYSDSYEVTRNTTLNLWDTEEGLVWAPVSGVGEAWAFGFGYFCFFAAAIAIIAFFAHRLLRAKGVFVAIFPIALFFIGFVITTMYPIRMGFRFMLLAGILSVVLRYRWRIGGGSALSEVKHPYGR